MELMCMEKTFADVCLYQENEKRSHYWWKSKVKERFGLFCGLICLLVKGNTWVYMYYMLVGIIS